MGGCALSFSNAEKELKFIFRKMKSPKTKVSKAEPLSETLLENTSFSPTWAKTEDSLYSRWKNSFLKKTIEDVRAISMDVAVMYLLLSFAQNCCLQ